MPRAAWIAVGAVAAAWLIPTTGLAISAAAAAVGLAAARLTATSGVGVRAGHGRATRILAATIGFLVIWIRLVASGPDASAVREPLPDDRGSWVMQVEAVGSPRDGQQTATLRLVPPAVAALRVAATLPAYPVVIPGDVVTVEGSIRPPPDSPYGAYLRRIDADGTLRATSMTVAPTGSGTAGPGRGLERLRRGAGTALATVLPEPEAGLAAGILIGLRDLVDRDLAATFTTAGVSHVVAISGWNIAIVAAAVGACAGRLGRRRRSVVTVLAIVAYVVVAGASASVVRAGVMAGVVLLARETGRAGQAATALGWTVVVLLLVDPGLVLDAGFQLSALATAGLIAWATPIGGFLERVSRHRLPGWLTENLGVSLAAQAATLPLILASFGRLSLVAPAVNLIVVPLIAPAMAAGLVALAAGTAVLLGAPPAIGAIVAAPAWVLLRTTVSIVQVGAGLPFASVALQAPLDVLTAVIAAGLIIGLHRRFGRAGPRSGAGLPGAHGQPGPAAAARPGPFPPGPDDVGRRALEPDGRARPGRDGPRRGSRRRGAPGRDRPHHRPRCRPGRRHPHRRFERWPPARRRRAGSDPSARRARSATAAVGPPPRRGRRLASARGSRRRPRPSPRTVPRGSRVRARDARTWARLRGLAGAPRPSWGAERRGLVAGDRLAVDEIETASPLAGRR